MLRSCTAVYICLLTPYFKELSVHWYVLTMQVKSDVYCLLVTYTCSLLIFKVQGCWRWLSNIIVCTSIWYEYNFLVEDGSSNIKNYVIVCTGIIASSKIKQMMMPLCKNNIQWQDTSWIRIFWYSGKVCNQNFILCWSCACHTHCTYLCKLFCHHVLKTILINTKIKLVDLISL